MRFPLILIKNDNQASPELITSPWQLGLPGLGVLQKRDVWVGTNCYMDGVHARIIEVSSKRRGSFWESLLHRGDAAYWDVKVETTTPKNYDLDIIKMELVQAVEHDDMNLTEFYSPACLTYLINRCTNFAEILVTGCLTGMWEAENATVRLPHLVPSEDTRDCVPCVTAPGYDGPLSAENVARLATEVVFTDHSHLFEEFSTSEK